MAKETFLTDFAPFACVGDTIEARVSLGPFFTGLRLVATIYADDCSDKPDQRDDGFWPSLDPDSPGYIGRKSAATLRRLHAHAERVMQAWRKDEWRYVGVGVRAWFDDTPLTDEYAHAVWGVEMNYPQMKGTKRNPNSYLRDLANESAYECAREAIRALTELVESGQ
jgi:hypothetical protein